jgi:hypothetical protein
MLSRRSLTRRPRCGRSGRGERGSEVVSAGLDRLWDRDGQASVAVEQPAGVMTVSPTMRWVPGSKRRTCPSGVSSPSASTGAPTWIGVGELSEQVIGGHAERLISAPDDHINQGGATTTQAMLDVAGRRRTPATLPGFHGRWPPERRSDPPAASALAPVGRRHLLAGGLRCRYSSFGRPRWSSATPFERPAFVEEQLWEVAQLLPVQRDNGAESRRAAGFGSQQNSVAAAAKVVPWMRGAVESFRQTGREEA